MSLNNLIENEFETLTKSDTLIQGLSLMDEYYIDVLPVLDKGEYLGLISNTDIIAFEKINSPISKHISNLEKISIQYSSTIFDAIKTFKASKHSILPVIDQKKTYLGYITANALLDYLGEVLGIESLGGILEIEIEKKDFSMSKIVHILESNDALLISSFLSSASDIRKIKITLKLNKENLESIIQSFNNNNISIVNSYNLSPREEIDYQNRFDSLMNFLDL